MRRMAGAAAALFTFTCAAACGDVTGFIDASTGDDDTIDAQTIDAPPTGQVTVTTRSRCCTGVEGALVSNIEVFVIQPDGSAGDSGQTNASGVVTLDDVVAGAAVIAAYPVDGGYELSAIVGVAPGDSLAFGETFYPSSGANTGTVSMTITSTPGSSHYYVFHPCGQTYFYDSSLTNPLYLYENCDTPTADLFIASYSNVDYSVQRSAIMRGVSYTPGSVLTMGAWSNGQSFNATATGVPAPVNEVYFDLRSMLTGQTNGPGYGQYATPSGGNATVSTSLGSGADSLFVRAQLRRDGDLGSQETYRVLAGATSSTTLAINELPWVGDSYYSAINQEARWTQLGDQDYDAAIVYASWYRGSGGDLFHGGSYYSLTMMLPPGVTQFSWGDDPPAALAELLPTVDDSINHGVMLIDLATADGYDEMRAVDERIYGCPQCAAERNTAGGDITVSYGDGGEGVAAAPPQMRPPWHRDPRPNERKASK